MIIDWFLPIETKNNCKGVLNCFLEGETLAIQIYLDVFDKNSQVLLKTVIPLIFRKPRNGIRVTGINFTVVNLLHNHFTKIANT